MSKKDREAEGWTPEQLRELADVPVPVPPSRDTVAALDVALDAFRAHYAAASPRFRQEAVAYIYLGIGRFELEAMRGPRRD